MTKRNIIAIFLSAFLIFIILAVIVANSLTSTNNQNDENTNITDNTGTNTNDEDTDTNIEVDLEGDSDLENTTIPGTYTQYSKDKLTNQINIIFFAAGWCPSCAELDSNLSAATDIPDGYIILKTDYDNSQEIREKYGVTIQHTLVQVDKNGNLIKKVNGLYSAFTLEDIIKEFN